MKSIHNFFPVTLEMCHLRNATEQVPHVGKSHQKGQKHHKFIKVGKDIFDHCVDLKLQWLNLQLHDT